MTSQFEIKWSNFESKFNGREQEDAFEQFIVEKGSIIGFMIRDEILIICRVEINI